MRAEDVETETVRNETPGNQELKSREKLSGREGQGPAKIKPWEIIRGGNLTITRCVAKYNQDTGRQNVVEKYRETHEKKKKIQK